MSSAERFATIARSTKSDGREVEVVFAVSDSRKTAEGVQAQLLRLGVESRIQRVRRGVLSPGTTIAPRKACTPA